MVKRVAVSLAILVAFLIGYLSFAPVPVDPVAWDAPLSEGFTGPYAANNRLADADVVPVVGHGPEDVAEGTDGMIYASVETGIVRMDVDGLRPEMWVETGGRPLGIDFDAGGNLIVADSLIGLLSISPEGRITELAGEAEGIGYANDVDVGADGRIFFSDVSSKFPAREFGGPYSASLLDILEHGAYGRLLVYDPRSESLEVVAGGFENANGVAVSLDQQFVLVCETSSYRVSRVWMDGRVETFVENLPGFPDNISTGLDGRFWLALVSPRNPLIDKLSGSPSLRKVIQRLPEAIRPKAVPYGHIVAFDSSAKVVADLQDPSGILGSTSGVIEGREFIWIGSLTGDAIGRLEKGGLGLH